MGDNYPFFLSGMPGIVSAGWLDTVAGGKQVMKLAGALPETKPLAVADSYKLDIPDGTNPSVVVHNEKLIVCVRTPTANVLGELAGRKAVGAVPVIGHTPSVREFNPWRLYSLAGHLGAVGCHADYGVKGTPHAQIALVTLAGGVMTGETVIPSARYEKNWMPCVDGDRLRLVYCVDPLVVLDSPYTVTDSIPMGGILRGSSQLIPYGEDKWLGIVHQTHLPHGAKTGVYLHRFVQFRRDLGAAWWGRPWHLRGQGVEIVAGLAFWQGRYIVSYGTDDMSASRAAWIAEVSPETVEEMLKEG